MSRAEALSWWPSAVRYELADGSPCVSPSSNPNPNPNPNPNLNPNPPPPPTPNPKPNPKPKPNPNPNRGQDGKVFVYAKVSDSTWLGVASPNPFP